MKPILILAAGASSRMGGVDKLLQEIDGVPLLIRSVRIAEASGHPVFVAIPGPWHPRYKALRSENVTCFDVPDASEGVGGSLRGAVKRLPPCDAFMVILADMPLIDTQDIQRLWSERSNQKGAKIVRATTQNGKPGHPIIFDHSLRDDFDALTGDDGAKSIVAAHVNATRLVALDGERARYDLDTPEDWQRWQVVRESENLVDVSVK